MATKTSKRYTITAGPSHHEFHTSLNYGVVFNSSDPRERISVLFYVDLERSEGDKKDPNPDKIRYTGPGTGFVEAIINGATRLEMIGGSWDFVAIDLRHYNHGNGRYASRKFHGSYNTDRRRGWIEFD